MWADWRRSTRAAIAVVLCCLDAFLSTVGLVASRTLAVDVAGSALVVVSLALPAAAVMLSWCRGRRSNYDPTSCSHAPPEDPSSTKNSGRGSVFSSREQQLVRLRTESDLLAASMPLSSGRKNLLICVLICACFLFLISFCSAIDLLTSFCSFAFILRRREV